MSGTQIQPAQFLTESVRAIVGQQPAEENLLQNQDIFRLLVEGVADYAIFLLDPEGRVASWNLGAERIKGYTAKDVLGKHFSIFYPPSAVAAGWPQYELSVAAREGRFEDEGWRVRKDGSRFWANVVITALRDSEGGIRAFSKVTRDLTARKQAEEQIQKLNSDLSVQLERLSEANGVIEERTAALRQLSGRLLRVQDEERRRVARELHEGLSQDLGAMKIILESALRNRRFDAVTGKAVEDGLELADRVLTAVRNLAYLLHPPLLDEAGLAHAVRWYVEGFAKRGGVETTLNVVPANFPRLSLEIETAVFRIVQEALANVVRHSRSRTAEVSIEKRPDRVLIRVRDYGVGVPADIESRLSAAVGVGVGGMRERARQCGGDLAIRPADPGTALEAWLPVENHQDAR